MALELLNWLYIYVLGLICRLITKKIVDLLITDAFTIYLLRLCLLVYFFDIPSKDTMLRDVLD